MKAMLVAMAVAAACASVAVAGVPKPVAAINSAASARAKLHGWAVACGTSVRLDECEFIDTRQPGNSIVAGQSGTSMGGTTFRRVSGCAYRAYVTVAGAAPSGAGVRVNVCRAGWAVRVWPELRK
jgi:hypothetical protein